MQPSTPTNVAQVRLKRELGGFPTAISSSKSIFTPLLCESHCECSPCDQGCLLKIRASNHMEKKEECSFLNTNRMVGFCHGQEASL